MNFSSSRTLVQHKVDSTDELCRVDLHTCLCCKKGFLSEHGLETHKRRSPQCLRATNIDDTVSIIPLASQIDDVAVEDDNLSDMSGLLPSQSDLSSDEDGDHEAMSIYEDDINFVICDKTSRRCVPKKITVTRSLLSTGLMDKAARKQESSNSPDSYSIFDRGFNNEILQFYTDCKTRNVQLCLNLERACEMRNLTSTDILIIDAFQQTKYKSLDAHDDIETMISNFWNHLYLVPDYSHCDSQIQKEDVMAFLFHHAFIKPNDNSIDDEGGRFDALDDALEDEDSIEGEHDVVVSCNDNVDCLSGQHKSSEMLHFQKEIAQARDGITFEKRERAKVELYNLLSNANCPKYVFEEVQQWASEYGDAMYGETPTKRNTFVASMGNKVYGEKAYSLMKPKKQNLVLPRGSIIPVMTFSLKGALLSLLSDPMLMTENNLLINCDNPRVIDKQDHMLGDINSGWWYHNTHRDVCKGLNDVLLPILLFIDGSNIDNNGRLSVEPVTMTLGIFNRSTRNQANAWKTIGFIENLANKTSHDKVKTNKQTKLKYQDIHAMIDHILGELKLIQGRNGGFDWTLSLNNRHHEITFKVAVQIVIGDCKGNDVLCARYGNHSEKTRGFCRDCKVTFTDSDNVELQCEYITKEDIKGKHEDELNAIGFHHIDNAFDAICFGAGNSGIYGSTPSEPLHSFKLGLCKYLFEGFLEAAPPDTIKLIDMKLSGMIKRGQHKSINELPSIAVLRNGVNSLATAGADEQMSRVFGTHLCLLDSDVMKSLATAKRFRKCPKRGVPVAIKEMGLKEAKKWQKVFERTILYYSWLYSPEHDIKDFLTTDQYRRYLVEIGREELLTLEESSRGASSSGKEDNTKQSRAERAVRSYLKAYKDCVCRSVGNGLKIVKFHQQLHYPNQILKDGSLLNIDGGRCESIAINNLKKPGSLSQKRAASLNEQIAHNLMCDQVIKDAWTMIEMTDGCLNNLHPNIVKDSKVPNGICGGSKFTMYLDNQEEPFVAGVDNVNVVVDWSGIQYNTHKEVALQRVVAKRLYLNLHEGGCLHKTSMVQGFTEYILNGQTLRCHPSYRSGDEWKDYAMISWAEDEETVPARICMFLNLENSLFMTDNEHSALRKDFGLGDEPMVVEPNSHEYLDRSKWVVVESCLSQVEMEDTKPSKFEVTCSFSEYHGFEEQLRILPLESIVGKAYCIDVGNQGDRVACLQDKNNWTDKFYSCL